MTVTSTAISWSEMDQKFWVRDGDDVLWFDSSLDARDAVRSIELHQAAMAERDRIVAWLRNRGDCWTTDAELAEAIEHGEYLK